MKKLLVKLNLLDKV